MAELRTFQMRGGPHDGFALDPEVAGSAPETLFQISFDDGSDYARSGEQVRDSAGRALELFCFDADGSLTEQARQRFAPLT